jgi:FKBP-type peptidyl-prolyl cis-trans isomerase FklB
VRKTFRRFFRRVLAIPNEECEPGFILKELVKQKSGPGKNSPSPTEVGMTGFEPAASSSRTKRATGLRYIPKNLYTLHISRLPLAPLQRGLENLTLVPRIDFRRAALHPEKWIPASANVNQANQPSKIICSSRGGILAFTLHNCRLIPLNYNNFAQILLGMKKSTLFFAAIAVTTLSLAQGQKTVPAKKPLPLLKNAADSFSYAVGLSISSFYKQQGVKNINTALVNKAINDGMMKDKKPLLTEDQLQACISNYLQKASAEKASGNIKIGEAFLAANKNKPGVITTASGLQYQILKEGTGPKPSATDKIKCHYHGTLINGTIFDSSVDRNQPIEYPVNGFIPGWIEALQLMPVGSKWKLFVPSNLAYGNQGSGPLIGPGATLIFELELLEILK